MSLIKEVILDLKAVDAHPIIAFLSNRGFHALLAYRISNRLWRWRIPVIPLILTRIIQILYAVDIDYRAAIDGGVLIVHGFGLVIGSGVRIVGGGQRIYHGVTLGIAHQPDDGFPTIGPNVMLGAGCFVLGKIDVPANCLVPANRVITQKTQHKIRWTA